MCTEPPLNGLAAPSVIHQNMVIADFVEVESWPVDCSAMLCKQSLNTITCSPSLPSALCSSYSIIARVLRQGIGKGMRLKGTETCQDCPCKRIAMSVTTDTHALTAEMIERLMNV